MDAGEPSWIRTSDLLIKSQLLYRLSYGPTLRRRLASRSAAGKAVSEMARRQRPFNPPARGDRRERMEHEAPFANEWVRDRQASRPELAAAPEYKVEIEHARAPAAASTAAEFALHLLQPQ